MEAHQNPRLRGCNLLDAVRHGQIHIPVAGKDDLYAAVLRQFLLKQERQLQGNVLFLDLIRDVNARIGPSVSSVDDNHRLRRLRQGGTLQNPTGNCKKQNAFQRHFLHKDLYKSYSVLQADFHSPARWFCQSIRGFLQPFRRRSTEMTDLRRLIVATTRLNSLRSLTSSLKLQMARRSGGRIHLGVGNVHVEGGDDVAHLCQDTLLVPRRRHGARTEKDCFLLTFHWTSIIRSESNSWMLGH